MCFSHNQNGKVDYGTRKYCQKVHKSTELTQSTGRRKKHNRLQMVTKAAAVEAEDTGSKIHPDIKVYIAYLSCMSGHEACY